MGTNKQSLSVGADLRNLEQVRRFVEETALAFGVVTQTRAAIRLAVDEAVTNVILHGYRGQAGNIEVEMIRVGGDLVIHLRDEAKPFDPTKVPPPDLSRPLTERPPGGLGVYLIRQTMDEIVYHPRPGGGNELTLLKRGVADSR